MYLGDKKNQIKQLWKKSTFGIRKKIFLLNFLFALGLILSLSMSVYNVVANYLRTESNNYVHKLGQQINNSIDTYLEEMEKTIRTIAMGKNVKHFFSFYNESNSERFRGILEFYDSAGAIIALKKYCGYYVFLEDSGYTYSSFSGDDTTDFRLHDVQKLTWYIKVKNSKKDLVLINDFHPIKNKSGESMFAYALKFQPGNEWENVFFLIVSKKSYFDDLIKNTDVSTMDFIVICDEDGNIIYDSKPEVSSRLGMDSGRISGLIHGNNAISIKSYDKSNYLVTINTSSKTGWNVISFTSETKLRKNTFFIKLMVYSITFVAIIILLAALFVISSRISNPIKRLTELIKNAQHNHHLIESNFKNNDEVEELWQSFNIMMRNLLDNEVSRKEAEIEALQQQINPHFLYNTLETINALAVKYRCPEIRMISEKLGDMFRYSINRNKHEYVSVSEEIEHVKNYISIQNIRFKEKFEFHFEVDQELYSYKTLKFILQPIVENAIYHGLEKIESDGILLIKGTLEGESIVFRIIDNGIGIDRERLRMLNEYIEQGISPGVRGSIGLRNVHVRINLIYGDPYGVHIFSEEGMGTEVVLRIPVKAGGKTNV